ncbi:uncharacterized protein LOC135219410 isoform X4 [Macrobrachium nipponense]|uniref:uncharacterized protein LOC135219410 isoform X4 n=1 Tax=Macrobrachium nipponense TaxID=159736 RepID=UPI0030C7B443
MLSLTDDVTDDWGFLKDFLSPKSQAQAVTAVPHYRDSETGELTYPQTAQVARFPAAGAPHPLSPSDSALSEHVTCPSPSVAVSPPQGLLSSPPPPPPAEAFSPLPQPGTPLPSISTLVRYPVGTTSPCSTDASSLTPRHEASPRRLLHEERCQSLEGLPEDQRHLTEIDERCVVPSEGSAFRSVTPSCIEGCGAAGVTLPAGSGTSSSSSGSGLPTKPSPSLLRDLLVLGKSPRSQHDQGRLGSLVRSGEMERWQEVVQYLGLPNPHQSQAPHTPMAAHTASPTHPHGHAPPLHHPQALYPSHDASPTPPTPPVPRGVLLNNASLPLPMSDPMTHNITYTNSMGASSHLVTSSMNLTNSSDLAGSDHNQYKMEVNSSLPTEMMYYQNSNSEMNQTTDGLLSSIFNDEALMEMAMTDYSGSRNHSGDYSGSTYRYPPEDPHRMPPVPLKKQHKFGRDIRYFHDNLPHGGPAGGVSSGSSSSVGGDVSGYGSHYPPPPGISSMEGATALDPSEMKFSCTMDFRSQGEVSGTGVDHVQHNHTYHLQPEGTSGLTRPSARDKQRNKKNEHERTLSRDEKRARAMNLPITCDDIINLPMDEFNERISKYDLTEAQLSLIRDIRRRGKNKVAAQNCRKRKLDQILHLADEVKAIQTRKNELCNEFEFLSSERTRIKHKFSLLYRHIFQSLRDPDGNPYSPHEYSLQQSADGSILLVPRSSHSMDPGSSSKTRGKEDGKQ